MVSFKEAFGLSALEVEVATPPGTAQIHRENFLAPFDASEFGG
jgi:hypothetical protein